MAAMTLALVLAGCGSAPRGAGPPLATAGGDETARPVGELRRLLLLPVVFEAGACRWPDAAARLDASSVLFLRDWKGYQALRPAGREPGVTRLAGDLAIWQDENPDGGRLPDALRGELGEVARTAGADGILVIRATPRCGGYATQALQAVARAVPSTIGGAAGYALSAAVYDADRGAPAWRRQTTPQGWADSPAGGPSPFDMQRAAEELFHPIENALPAVLQQPAAAPPTQ